MARNIRAETQQRIHIAYEKSPFSMGPLLGELALKMNISAGIVAIIIDAHEQSVLRWFFGQSEMQPHWIKKSARLFGVLIWMNASNRGPLLGDNQTKMLELTKQLRAFEQAATAVA